VTNLHCFLGVCQTFEMSFLPACLPEFEEETLILWKRRNNINERATSTLGSVSMDLYRSLSYLRESCN